MRAFPIKIKICFPERKDACIFTNLWYDVVHEKKEDSTMHAALVIMAAGMGSRYGGNKQVDGVGPHGEISDGVRRVRRGTRRIR